MIINIVRAYCPNVYTLLPAFHKTNDHIRVTRRLYIHDNTAFILWDSNECWSYLTPMFIFLTPGVIFDHSISYPSHNVLSQWSNLPPLIKFAPRLSILIHKEVSISQGLTLFWWVAITFYFKILFFVLSPLLILRS